MKEIFSFQKLRESIFGKILTQRSRERKYILVIFLNVWIVNKQKVKRKQNKAKIGYKCNTIKIIKLSCFFFFKLAEQGDIFTNLI